MKKTSKIHVFHMRRLGLFSLLFLSVLIVKSDAGAFRSVQPPTASQVLAYAAEMSRPALLSGTNAARLSNGLPALAIDSQLNNAAQAKAQHMTDNNYWAHVAPDGTQPWYFFSQAGYTYIRAGENLAYGFMSSQGAIDGWMNSPSHKANMLGDFHDVGFGIVNSQSYQSNGQQTIVVAHYGTRATAPEPAPAAPTATTATPPSAPPATPATQSSQATPAPVTSQSPAASEDIAETTKSGEQPAAPVSVKPKQGSELPADSTAAVIAPPVQTGNSTNVSVLGMIATRTVPIAALTSLTLMFVAIIGYTLTHRSAFQRAVTAGEHFAFTHPGIDAGVVAAIATLILLTTYGTIG